MQKNKKALLLFLYILLSLTASCTCVHKWEAPSESQNTCDFKDHPDLQKQLLWKKTFGGAEKVGFGCLQVIWSEASLKGTKAVPIKLSSDGKIFGRLKEKDKFEGSPSLDLSRSASKNIKQFRLFIHKQGKEKLSSFCEKKASNIQFQCLQDPDCWFLIDFVPSNSDQKGSEAFSCRILKRKSLPSEVSPREYIEREFPIEKVEQFVEKQASEKSKEYPDVAESSNTEKAPKETLKEQAPKETPKEQALKETPKEQVLESIEQLIEKQTSEKSEEHFDAGESFKTDKDSKEKPPEKFTEKGCTSGTNRSCYSGSSHTQSVGSCRAGTSKCQNGAWEQCLGEIKPQAETCNGKDDDCDGSIDEKNPSSGRPCALKNLKGACSKGKTICSGGKVTCTQTVQPKEEHCSNGIDDSCNGKVDDCGVCNAGQTRPCYTANTGCILSSGKYTCKGGCHAGTQTCANGAWESCANQSIPQIESCNWKDENCNGQIDENDVCFYSSWTTSPFPTGAKDALFLTPQIGVAIGSAGKTWRTINSGKTWILLPSISNSTLNRISAHKEKGIVLIVGNGGTILRSTNFGASFAKITTNISNDLHGVAIVTGKYAFAVGSSGKVLKSSDGGETWSNSSQSASNTLYSVTFTSNDFSKVAIAVGSQGIILKTTNSGSSWSKVNTTSSLPSTLNDVLWSKNTGLIVGSQGKLLKSTNSGSSWMAISGVSTQGNLKRILSPGSDTFIIASDKEFYLSTDDAKSFKPRKFGFAGSYTGITLRTPTALLALHSGKSIQGEGPARFKSAQKHNETFSSVAYDSSTAGTGAIALAVGASGMIYRSTDTGQTWQQVASPTTEHLFSVGLHRSIAIAVGYKGIILRSDDAGKTWAKVKSRTSNTLYGTAIDGRYSFAVGKKKTLLRSSDTGRTWLALTAPGQTNSYPSLRAISAKGKYILAVGEAGKIFSSSNYGAKWVEESSGTKNMLYGVSLYSKTSGIAFAVGSGETILYSRTNGSSWSKATLPLNLKATIYGVSNAHKFGMAAGSNGTVLSTSDFGKTWSFITGLPKVHFSSIFRNHLPKRHLIVGDKGSIYRTTDKVGKAGSWSMTKLSKLDLESVVAINSQSYVAISSQGAILYTSNSGTSWSLAQTPSNSILYDIAKSSSSPSVLVAVGSKVILYSTNGGQSWSTSSLPPSQASHSYYGVFSPASKVFLAVTTRGAIVRSTNGGISFQTEVASSGNLQDITCVSSTCFASGYSGKIMKSTNQGSSWTTLSKSTSDPLYNLAMNSATEIITGGYRGTIYYSTNGGSSWGKAQMPSTRTFHDFVALGNGRYLAADNNGQIWASVDKGANWTPHSPPTGTSIKGMSFTGNSGLAVGSDFQIIHIQYKP